jgi:hypothetical protein
MLSGGRDQVVHVWNLHDFSLKKTVPVFEQLEGLQVRTSCVVWGWLGTVWFGVGWALCGLGLAGHCVVGVCEGGRVVRPLPLSFLWLEPSHGCCGGGMRVVVVPTHWPGAYPRLRRRWGTQEGQGWG